jgi:ATP-dependent RNA helicase RhlE
MQFAELNLIEPLLRAIAESGYDQPTVIQGKAIPPVLEGRDVLGLAQTGTGKTAAFALPILQRIASKPRGRQVRALILTPTRELASQIGANIATYSKYLGVTHTVVFGGVSQFHQERALRRGAEILVATPGRLLDLCHQRIVSFDGLECLVLDEADRMLDMGFLHDVRRILSLLPKQRQTLFFSATMPQEITSLADSILVRPVRVEAAPVGQTADRIEQSVRFVAKEHKRGLLVDLLRDPSIERALVFTRTKHGADRVAKHLDQSGVASAAIHGNKSQGARERALGDFKRGATRVLVATDIAARGIDVSGISHVFNFDLPNVPESYVHRIGRTARAGASGVAVSFCEREERSMLNAIERLIGTRIPVASDARDASAAGSFSGSVAGSRAALSSAPSPAPSASASAGAASASAASGARPDSPPGARRFRRRRFRRAA